MISLKSSIGSADQLFYIGRGISLEVLEGCLKDRTGEVHIVRDAGAQADELVSEIIRRYSATQTCISVTPNKKDISDVVSLLCAFNDVGLSRRSIIICIGGGTIGDICGVACSLYMRGIDYIQVGTTLMSIADPIVAKVAVCLNGKKNICGSFYGPKATICDLDNISWTNSGLSACSEIVKHEILSSPTQEALLERLQCLHDKNSFLRIIDDLLHNSIRTKISYVEQDPYDISGPHKALSIGHTFANVIETISPEISHGDAVFIGILLCLQISEKLFALSPEIRQSVLSIIEGLNIQIPKLEVQRGMVLDLFTTDKISINKTITLVLLDSENRFRIRSAVSHSDIDEAFINNPYISYI